MTRNDLRIALTVLSVGFALEGTAQLYEFLHPGSIVFGESGLFALPFLLAFAGLIFVWIGCDEWWKDVHQGRARTATRIFVATVLGGFVAAGLVVGLVEEPSIGTPLWAQLVFGGAIASLVFGTLATCAYLLYHLVSRPTRLALHFALAWGLIVSGVVGAVFASHLAEILTLPSQRTVEIPAFVASVGIFLSYLFVSFFLLFAASVEAHIAVVRGTAREPNAPGVPVVQKAKGTDLL
jgi:hypothetical protein